MTYEKIKEALGKIIDPGYDKPLSEVSGIDKLLIDPTGIVEATILLRFDERDKNTVKREIVSILKLDFKLPSVKIDFGKNILALDDTKKIKYIGVASGKGGVGKSTVTINLAKALTKLGHKVGIIDADVYGASIPTILGINEKHLEESEDEMIFPANYEGIEIISTAFFVETDKPLLWRAPMLNQLLTHFFNGIKWNSEIEYIIIDLPPGTGDVMLDLKIFVPAAKMIIVTTANMDATMIALKAGIGSINTGHEVIGVIENMSYYGEENNKDYIFGTGGGRYLSDCLDVDLLAQIPITKDKKRLAPLYEEIANKIINNI